MQVVIPAERCATLCGYFNHPQQRAFWDVAPGSRRGKAPKTGPELARLLSDIEKSPPLQAVQKLRQLQLVPQSAVQQELSSAVHCVNGLFKNAATQEVRYIAQILSHVSNAVKDHPALIQALKQHQKTVFELIEKCTAKGVAYKDSTAVIQLSSAQSRLQVCYGPFWENVRKKSIDTWSPSAAKSYLLSFGRLCDANVVPASEGRREELIRHVVVRHADSMDAPAVAKTIWVFGSANIALGFAKLPMMNALSREIEYMRGNRVSDVMWAFARLSLRLHALQEPVMRAVTRSCEEMGPRALSNTLWAFARLELDLGEAKQPLMQAVVQKAPDMGAQAVSNTLWALSKLEVDPGNAKTPLLETLMLRVEHMNSRSLANTLYALVRLDTELLFLKSLEEPLRQAVVKLARKMSPQDVACTFWAFGKLEVGLGAAADPLLAAVSRVAHGMQAWMIGRTFWALTKMKMDPGDAGQSLLQAASREAENMNSEAISDTIFAIWKFRLDKGAKLRFDKPSSAEDEGIWWRGFEIAIDRESHRMSLETRARTEECAGCLGLRVGKEKGIL